MTCESAFRPPHPQSQNRYFALRFSMHTHGQTPRTAITRAEMSLGACDWFCSTEAGLREKVETRSVTSH